MTETTDKPESFIVITFKDTESGVVSINPVNVTPAQVLYAAVMLKIQGEFQISSMYAKAEQEKIQQQLIKMNYEREVQGLIGKV